MIGSGRQGVEENEETRVGLGRCIWKKPPKQIFPHTLYLPLTISCPQLSIPKLWGLIHYPFFQVCQ